MTLSDKALSVVGTARTFWSNFAGPCLWIGISAAVIGAGVSGYGAFKVTRAFYQRATLKAEKETLEWKAAASEARAENQRLSNEVSAYVLGERDAIRNKIDDVAADLTRVADRVQVCARKSDVRVSLAPSGAIETTPNGELRDLAAAITEFATACAIGRDRDAADHNALVEWLERVKPAKND